MNLEETSREADLYENQARPVRVGRWLRYKPLHAVMAIVEASEFRRSSGTGLRTTWGLHMSYADNDMRRKTYSIKEVRNVLGLD